MIDVYLAEDHKLLVEALNTTLNASERIRIVRSFTTLEACRKALAVEQPAILLLDLSMPDGDGIAFCREVGEEYPGMKVIALTMHDECSMVRRTMESGAKGYLLKSISCEELMEAIERVYEGATYLCKEVVGIQRRYADDAGIHLTKQERKVLNLLVDGYSNEEIAKELFISTATVKWHRRNIIAKFGLPNMGMVISKTIKERLV